MNLEKIFIQANQKLALIPSGVGRDEQLPLFRSLLKVEMERLRIQHRFGASGSEIAGGRSYLIDLVVRRACQLATVEPEEGEGTCSVVALGGYGRAELAPASDIDLLFLHAGRRCASAKVFAEQVLYLLWDIGLTVGHSFRSVSECVAMAKSDLHSRTAVADARLVTGNAHLFRRLNKELDRSIYTSKRETETFLESMNAELESRYARWGRSVGMQEPNVKEGAGGLRDLHAVIWVGQAVHGSKGLDALRAEDHINGDEYASLRRACEFLMRVRNEAHFQSAREADVLTLEAQAGIASALGYQPAKGLESSEVFMREYYHRANDLHRLSGFFLDRTLRRRLRKTTARGLSKRALAGLELRQESFYLTIRKRVKQDVGGDSGFKVKNSELVWSGDLEELVHNPDRIMEAYSKAASLGVQLNDELKQAIMDALPRAGRKLKDSPHSRRLFVEVLGRKGHVGAALRAMHETGFLGRLLPEFGKITFLVQHDFYHKYTIDEHTLRALEALDGLTALQDDERLGQLAGVLGEIEDATALYLGTFLHDIGKGRGPGHVSRGARIAERLTARLELDSESASSVEFLVRNHLLMSHLAQRRDLAEDGLIDKFCAVVGTVQRLNALLLLTYADMSGVAPGVWNDWRASMLWELYQRARGRLTGERVEGEGLDGESAKSTLIATLRGEFKPSEIERHFALLPPRYRRRPSLTDITNHLRLIRQLDEGTLIAGWAELPDKHCSELTVVTRDKPGLFASIAGTLTAHGINILSADLYTREDGFVIDTFRVCEVNSSHPIRPSLWPRIEQNLRNAVEGSYNVADALAAWLAKERLRLRRRGRAERRRATVSFDQAASAASTVIEVRVDDQPGLAYKIASSLASIDLNINFAKITTERGRVLDVFYLTGSEGRKLANVELPAVERAVLEGLDQEIPRMKEAV
ncbi:MAG TPA: [protein-PII] uridylyltransferase [Blastocatellia bacterium]|nr:[protein-PII] uridylyltransferase [Blastocatellia bacterium]